MLNPGLSLSTILGQEVMPWHKATKTIGTTPLFGVAVHAGGFNGRPTFLHMKTRSESSLMPISRSRSAEPTLVLCYGNREYLQW